MTDEVLEDTIWESVRPWEEQWESLKVNESKVVEQELYDEDRQTRFWRRRPDGFTVNRKEHIIYVLEFKRVSDTGERYVSETQKLAEIQRRDTRSQKTVQGYTMDSWAVVFCNGTQVGFCKRMTFRHEPVFEVWCQERGQGQGYQESETDPVGSAARMSWKTYLGHIMWAHQLGVSDGLIQVLGHSDN